VVKSCQQGVQGDAVPLPERAGCLVSSLISLLPSAPQGAQEGVQGDAVLLPEREVLGVLAHFPLRAAGGSRGSAGGRRPPAGARGVLAKLPFPSPRRGRLKQEI